jgi:hypothetical protein
MQRRAAASLLILLVGLSALHAFLGEAAVVSNMVAAFEAGDAAAASWWLKPRAPWAPAARLWDDAYRATAPGVFGVTSDHYCCTRWASGCQSADAAAPAAASAGDSAFFLSPSGSDTNDGLSPSTPWLTLPRAQAAVVALKAANGGALPGDVRVSLAAGTYELGAAFTITQADGGDAAHSEGLGRCCGDAAQPHCRCRRRW